MVFHLSFAGAADTNKDQVGIVIPAFSSDSQEAGDIGKFVAYALKLRITKALAKDHPRSGKVIFGSAAVYFVPKPMKSQDESSAESLAQMNGMQGTLWGISYQLRDGVAVNSYLTLSRPFLDYRKHRNEVWQVAFEDFNFLLEPPETSVKFSSVVFTNDAIKKYGDFSNIQYCRKDNGNCVTFSDFEITRVLDFKDNYGIVRRNQVDYKVQFPTDEVLSSEGTDYCAMVIAYFRNNLFQVIDLSERLINDPSRSSVSVRIDALLYRGAAHSRLGLHSLAQDDFLKARKLNTIAKRTLRYQMMGDLARWSSSKKTKEGKESLRSFLKTWSFYQEKFELIDDFDYELRRFAKSSPG
jgi:hypothetical protein